MPHTSNPSPNTRQLREFGLVVGGLILLLFSWLLPALHGHPPKLWPIWIGSPLVLLGLVAPRLLRQPYRAWMALGHGLGWINSHLILGLVYGLVLQPIALVMRLAGHDPLRRRWDPAASSYREPSNPEPVNLTTPF